jgi:hypothetical protein
MYELELLELLELLRAATLVSKFFTTKKFIVVENFENIIPGDVKQDILRSSEHHQHVR